MNRFIFEPANHNDGRELLEIIEENIFGGKISLLYTRRPDAYFSMKNEGEEVDIVVCRDLERKKIVGFGVCAIRSLFVNGRRERVGYLFGLRCRREYLKIYPLLYQGYEFLHNLHKNKDIQFYITTILEDNIYAQKLLEKKREFMPIYEPFGFYEVYVVRTIKNFKRFPELNFKKAEKKRFAIYYRIFE